MLHSTFEVVCLSALVYPPTETASAACRCCPSRSKWQQRPSSRCLASVTALLIAAAACTVHTVHSRYAVRPIGRDGNASSGNEKKAGRSRAAWRRHQPPVGMPCRVLLFVIGVWPDSGITCGQPLCEQSVPPELPSTEEIVIT